MKALGIAGAIGIIALSALPAFAQTEVKTIAAKGGETVDLLPVYGARNCRSTLVSTPEVEVLQGPAEVKLSVREEMVTPKNCAAKIKGGVVVATIAALTKPVDGKLTFRVKYKAKDGDHQVGHVYNVALIP
jgi:hypothetical protein